MAAQEIITIPAAATVSLSDSICGSLKEALSAAPDVVIDCSAIEDADISFVQLVIAARHSAKRDGKSFGLHSPASGPLLDILRRSGLVSGDDGRHSEEERFWLKMGD